jgi:hypothetical protein
MAACGERKMEHAEAKPLYKCNFSEAMLTISLKLTLRGTFCDNNFNEVLALARGKGQANARYTNTQ